MAASHRNKNRAPRSQPMKAGEYFSLGQTFGQPKTILGRPRVLWSTRALNLAAMADFSLPSPIDSVYLIN
jgi:hypothetical protein